MAVGVKDEVPGHVLLRDVVDVFSDTRVAVLKALQKVDTFHYGDNVKDSAIGGGLYYLTLCFGFWSIPFVGTLKSCLLKMLLMNCVLALPLAQISVCSVLCDNTHVVYWFVLVVINVSTDTRPIRPFNWSENLLTRDEKRHLTPLHSVAIQGMVS